MTHKTRPLSHQLQMAQIFILILFITFGAMLYGLYLNIHSQNLIDINAAIVSQTADAVAAGNSNVSIVMDSLSYSSALQSYLVETDPLQKAASYSSLQNLMLNYQSIIPNLRGIVVRSQSGGYVSNGDIPLVDINKAFEQTEDALFSEVFYYPTSNEYRIFTRKPIYQVGSVRTKIGDCMFALSVNYITSDIQNFAQDSRSQLFIVDSRNSIIASNHTAMITQTLPQEYLQFIPADDAQHVYNQGDVFSVSRKIDHVNWSIISVIPIQSLFKDLLGITKATILLSVICFLLLSVIYVRFFRRITQSLTRFMLDMRRIESGVSGQANLDWDNLEFQNLALTFNKLLCQMQTLREKDLENQKMLYLKDITSKRAQILALQSQINPHFLYNTLECINSAGAVYGSWEVQEMAVCLASIFHYSIKGNHIVTLNDEIDTVIAYLRIQRIRFPDKFSTIFDIAEQVRSVKMVKFILQPIVENCIFHGVETTTEPCAIVISAHSIENAVVISISDNGSGMDDEQLQTIQQALLDDAPDILSSSASIGLTNISRRIKLHYGAEYGLCIASRIGEGTCVTLTLPILEESES